MNPFDHIVRSDARVRSVAARYRRALRPWAPEIRSAADDLLARISTPNWSLEWGLAQWTGEAYGLGAQQIANLDLANALLLAVARHTDDVADGESRLPARTAAVVNTALQQVWLQQVAALFADSPCRSLFWDTLGACLAEWTRVTVADGRGVTEDFLSFGPRDYAFLSHRGSFLKVAAAAGCLLGNQRRRLKPLEDAISELTVGIVMLDDQFDWVADASAGRYNVFIAYGAHAPQSAAASVENVRAVIHELHTGRGVHPYFDRLEEWLLRAARSARRAACPGLGHFIECYRQEANACRDWLATAVQTERTQRFQCRPNGRTLGAKRGPRRNRTNERTERHE
jgi:hypothetical protein